MRRLRLALPLPGANAALFAFRRTVRRRRKDVPPTPPTPPPVMAPCSACAAQVDCNELAVCAFGTCGHGNIACGACLCSACSITCGVCSRAWCAAPRGLPGMEEACGSDVSECAACSIRMCVICTEVGICWDCGDVFCSDCTTNNLRPTRGMRGEKQYWGCRGED